MRHAYSYIRFSSEKQSLGDSLRRQVKGAEDYAAKHGLTLDSLSYRDLGVSAFKGKNAEEGRLAAFLEGVNTGRITRGSYLLIENFDRLSRNEIDAALTLFLQIIGKGITIVTLTDEAVYTKESINKDVAQLIASILYMGRAHDESKRKSGLVKKAWDTNRANWKPGQKLISKKGPAWLKAAADGKSWIQLPDKVAVVQRVYKLAADGIGQVKITNTLNDERVPTMDAASFWSQGVVGAMLRNPSVMGTFTQKRGGTQVIESYFPEIVPKATWLFVQDAIKNRRTTGGTKSDKVNNLFSGLSFCLYCGSRTRFVPTHKSNAYVHCLKAYSNAGCDARPFPYRAAETAVLDRLMNAQLRILDNKYDLEEVDKRILIDQEVEELKKLQARALETQLLAGNVAALADTLKKLQTQIETLEAKRKDLDLMPVTEEELRSAAELYRRHEKLLKEGTTELDDLRRSIQSALRRQLKKIEFAAEFMESKLFADNLGRTPKQNKFFDGKRSTFQLSDTPDFIVQLTFASGKVRVVDATPFISNQSKGRRAANKKRA